MLSSWTTNCIVFIAACSLATARTFTVHNACPFTIWPAVYTDLKVGSAVPNISTGWEAAPFTNKTFWVPGNVSQSPCCIFSHFVDNWRAGRIWGRRDCNFTRPDVTSCLTGSCIGGLLCDAANGSGIPPASVAEWTLEGVNGTDQCVL